MKKLIALGAAAVLAVTLVGCSGGGEEQAVIRRSERLRARRRRQRACQREQAGHCGDGLVRRKRLHPLWRHHREPGRTGRLVPHHQGDREGRLRQRRVVRRADADDHLSRPENSRGAARQGNGTAPDSVEFEVSTKSSNWIDGDPVDQQYELTGVSAQDNGYGMIDFVGEIENLTDADVDSVCVNVLLRDAGGAIVAGYSGLCRQPCRRSDHVPSRSWDTTFPSTRPSRRGVSRGACPSCRPLARDKARTRRTPSRVLRLLKARNADAAENPPPRSARSPPRDARAFRRSSCDARRSQGFEIVSDGSHGPNRDYNGSRRFDSRESGRHVVFQGSGGV